MKGSWVVQGLSRVARPPSDRFKSSVSRSGIIRFELPASPAGESSPGSNAAVFANAVDESLDSLGRGDSRRSEVTREEIRRNMYRPPRFVSVRFNLLHIG